MKQDVIVHRSIWTELYRNIYILTLQFLQYQVPCVNIYNSSEMLRKPVHNIFILKSCLFGFRDKKKMKAAKVELES